MDQNHKRTIIIDVIFFKNENEKKKQNIS